MLGEQYQEYSAGPSARRLVVVAVVLPAEDAFEYIHPARPSCLEEAFVHLELDAVAAA